MNVNVKQVRLTDGHGECEVTLTVDAIPPGAEITPETVARWMEGGEVPGSLYVLVDADGEALDMLSSRQAAEQSRDEWRMDGTRAKLYAIPREWVLAAFGDGSKERQRTVA